MSLDFIRAIETRALAAWPAPVSVLDQGWVLRAAGGYTKRANSANALSAEAEEGANADVAHLTALIHRVETFYTAQSLPTIFRLTPLAGESIDGLLDAAGYRQVDPTWVMSAPLAALTGSFTAEGDSGSAAASASASSMLPTTLKVLLEDAPTVPWSDGYARLNALSETRHAAHDDILANIRDRAIFATVMAPEAETLMHSVPSDAPLATMTAVAPVSSEAPVAYGMAVINDGMVGIFDIIVDSAWRGRGVGRQLMRELLAWAERAEAHTAYLQVTAGNEAALDLYRRLGFKTAYAYHYRIKDR